jgi:hypothetical protein
MTSRRTREWKHPPRVSVRIEVEGEDRELVLRMMERLSRLIELDLDHFEVRLKRKGCCGDSG